MLLFGAETWVVNPCMGQVMGGLQYQMLRSLMDRVPRNRSYGIWEYSLAEAEREEVGFKLMETYIKRR